MDDIIKEKTIKIIDLLEEYIITLKDMLEKDLIYQIEADISNNVGTMDLVYQGMVNTVTTLDGFDIINLRVDYGLEPTKK